MPALSGRRFLLGLAALVLAAGAAGAQDLDPARPIRLVVPFAAGGATDTVARILAEPLAKRLGQPVRVENVAGAGGTTGIARVAQAAPDGRTIALGTLSTNGSASALYRGLRYDPAESFDPIGMVVATPIVLVARKDFPAQDLKGFIGAIETDGPAIHQAQAGNGSVAHSAGVLFASLCDAQPTLVVYRGTGPALQDLIAGRVDFMADQIANVAPDIRAGTIRAYAIATKERSPTLPGVPTAREAGLPAFEMSAWNAVFAPRGLPADVRARLTAALNETLDDEAVRARLQALGGVVPSGPERGPEALQALVEREAARWTPLLRDAQSAEPEEQ